MKSNMITKMITMCMCMVVVGFAAQKGQEPINLEANQERLNYPSLESHNGSTIQDWDINDYTEHLSDDKAAAFGHTYKHSLLFELPGKSVRFELSFQLLF